MLPLPAEVQIKGSLRGKTDELTYCDHDLTDAKKCPRFQSDQYLIGQKQGVVASFLEDAKAKLEQLVIGTLVEELKAQKSQLSEAIIECREGH